MTLTNNPDNLPHIPTWTVLLSHQQLNFLCGLTKQGASRLAAYFDLLNRVTSTTTQFQLPYGGTISLEPGQTVVSITELAESWQWARLTVRKFFDQMSAMDLLSKEQLDRCSVITLKMEWSVPESTTVTSDSDQQE